MLRIKPAGAPKAPRATPVAALGPGGSPGASGAVLEAQAKGPAGKGFLINHNAFTDERPPGIRGARKSQGYPNFKPGQ